MHGHRTCAAVAACLTIALPLAAVAAGAGQLLANPHFTEWQSAQPVGWQVLGNPSIWWTDSLSGAKRTPTIGVPAKGDGFMQRVPVESGVRYYVRALTGVSPKYPAVLAVRDTASGKILFSRQADSAWPQEHVGFFFATGSEVEFSCRSVSGGGSLQIDDVALRSLVPDPTPPRVPIPDVPVFYSSVDAAWTRALTAVNVVNDVPSDPELREELRRRGVLCLARVHVPNRKREITDDLDAQVDELVAHWMRPLLDTRAGTDPTGADGIIVDELDAFDDDDPELEKWEKALAELRRLFPNKIIAIWGSNSIAALTADGEPRTRVMRLLNRYADLFMIEIYQATCPRNPGPDWVDGARGYGRNLPEFRQAAAILNENCPELLVKTVVCLVTSQNIGMNFDLDSAHNFLDWLRVQMTNIPRRGRDLPCGFAGIGQWVTYRARLSTLVAFEQYVREVFLAPEPLRSLGDDDALHPIGDANFEAGPDSSWAFTGAACRRLYADTKLVNNHDGKAEHFAQFAEVPADPATSAVRQAIRVQPGSWQQLSVYALPLHADAAAVVRVLAHDRTVAEATETLAVPTTWWRRLTLTFRVPSDTSAVTVEFRAHGADGASVAYDFVDLGPADGLNRTPSIKPLPRLRLGSLPKTVTLRGTNLLPNDIIRIGTDIYPDVEYVSSRKLRVRIPRLPGPGEYSVTVRHDDWLGEARSATLEAGLHVSP